MDLIYNFNGTRHVISREEVALIEQSGPPHRVQDYAHLHEGYKYSATYRGATMQVGPEPDGPEPLSKVVTMKIHLDGHKCGGAGARSAYNSRAFAILVMTDPFRACRHCARKILQMTPTT
jgi:hypothetical protein